MTIVIIIKVIIMIITIDVRNNNFSVFFKIIIIK